jgi:RNA 2',3'-cyclic 3'-phosphodiesterase
MQYAFSFYRDQREQLFFCVRPDAETGLLIDQYKRRFLRERSLDGQLRDKGLLHITLHGAGRYEDLPKHIIAAAKRAADAISMPPFRVTLYAIGSYPQSKGNIPLVLLARSNALQGLHKGMASEMRRNGFRVDKCFNPHMTLHYCSQVIPEQPIEPISFAVREFVFIHSEWGLSRHNVIDSWPLQR